MSVKARDDEDNRLAEGKEDGEQLLGSLVELAVRLEVEVDVDEVGAGQKLEDHARGDDRGDSQFHQRSSVTGHHHTQPVQRIRVVGRHDAVQGHLAHDEEDEEGQAGPYEAVVEGDLALGQLNLGDERHEGLDEVEEAYCRPWQVSLMDDTRRGHAIEHLRPLMVAV